VAEQQPLAAASSAPSGEVVWPSSSISSRWVPIISLSLFPMSSPNLLSSWFTSTSNFGVGYTASTSREAMEQAGHSVRRQLSWANKDRNQRLAAWG
jgi:hypothetical protein